MNLCILLVSLCNIKVYNNEKNRFKLKPGSARLGNGESISLPPELVP